MTGPSPFDLQPARPPKAPFWSTWEDALDIFYSPTQVFERRRDGQYGLILLILLALTVAVYFLSAQVTDAIGEIEFAKAMAAQAKSGQSITPEQLAQGRAFAAKIQGLLIYILPLLIAIGAWISGLIIMVLGNLMGAKLTFAQGTTVGILSNFPSVLGGAAVGAQGLVLDPATITSKYSFATSAARFLPVDTNAIVLKLAALADPFVIWSAVLLGIGAYVIGRMEKEKAAVLAVIHAIGFALLFR